WSAAASSTYGRASGAGRATGTDWPTASEYFRYVSMDATTTRASTVMRSMPTSDTRTHASITMPLSSTRSRTSIRLEPPEALSTGMRTFLHRERDRGHGACFDAARIASIARVKTPLQGAFAQLRQQSDSGL